MFKEVDKSEWVWGYERLGDFLLMKVFLALIFTVIALTVLYFAFNTWWDIIAVEAGKSLGNVGKEITGGLSNITRILPLGL
ncbi:MAG: hypothetical protein ACPLSJ_03790 [Thermosulfidibacteraceae bacterium]|jgi:hypothetical protein